MVPEIDNNLLRGKSEHWYKNFRTNLNVFVLAHRTVRFSGEVYYYVRTHIQLKFCQNSKEDFYKMSGANLNSEQVPLISKIHALAC
jgi:hypothetical protein